MKVKRSELVALLQKAGMANADKWNAKKLIERVSQVDDKIDDVDELGSYAKLYEQLLDAIKEEEEIVVDDDTDAPAKSEKGKGKDKGKDEKKKKKSEDGEKKKAKTVERDKFGSSVNSQCATINAAIGKKPKPVDKIIEEVVAADKDIQPPRIRSHLQWLKNKKLVELDKEKGWYEVDGDSKPAKKNKDKKKKAESDDDE